MKDMVFGGIVRLHTDFACSKCKQRMDDDDNVMLIKYDGEPIQLLCSDCNEKRVKALVDEINSYTEAHAGNIDEDVVTTYVRQINPFDSVSDIIIELIEEAESCDCPVCRKRRGGKTR